MRPIEQQNKPIFGEKRDNLTYERRSGCYAVIPDEAELQVAVVTTPSGACFLPGGGMEGDESPEACLRRELLEETGYLIRLKTYLGAAERYFVTPRGEPIWSDASFYLAELAEKVAEPAEPDHRLLWIPAEDAGRLLYHEHQAWAVAKALTKDALHLEELDLLQTDISELVQESLSEGHRHISRLLDDYRSGSNTFSKDGEVLLAAKWNGQVIGVCGLNRDPYQDVEGVGRIRRLYVMKEFRRGGVARRLMQAILETAERHYKVVILRTDNPGADRFYHSLGFTSPTTYSDSTHELKLR